MFARVSALHGTLHHHHRHHRHSLSSSPCPSRPPSRTVSLCDASSGYESTRSHLGPHYSDYNMPRNNSPVLRYNSLKPRRRKHKRSQFYSLRLCRKHENDVHRKYQLYAIPIYKCPHKNGSTSTIATIVRSGTPSLSTDQSIDRSENSNETRSNGSHSSKQQPGENRSQCSTAAPTPPIPAPRKLRKTDPSKHTYQNVPPPVFPPKNASLPRTKVCRLLVFLPMYVKYPYSAREEPLLPPPALPPPLKKSLVSCEPLKWTRWDWSSAPGDRSIGPIIRSCVLSGFCRMFLQVDKMYVFWRGYI